MVSGNYYHIYRCPKCDSYDRKKVDYLKIVCNKCGFEENINYEDIPHQDSFCTVVSSSGSDKILYKSDIKDEK